ncbi:hypothetical protein JOD03_001739 [Chryseomicrobium aureum]|uniref:DUF7683 domain-containing protein n=1 Tax=Chryseomicrobium aureum TaxID=1441723 RepID=UPI001957D975|nr:hypothetical protein [Chryseomicrobium aureum]MBM7706834.1 hypothetical protein [Chryseomicrobium aureum]
MKINHYRITKYNPIFRDEFGAYTKPEWTGIHDIGKTCDGQVLTRKDYLKVESAYSETVMKFLKEAKIDKVRTILPDNEKRIVIETDTTELFEDDFKGFVLEDDALVNNEDVPLICKLNLRDLAYCELISGDNFFVHFGYDYYMFIGVNQKYPEAIEFAMQQGLFVEEIESPYFISEENTTRTISWSKKGHSIVEEELVLPKLSREDLQKTFGLSSEHPVLGAFKITPSNNKIFTDFINFDFDQFDYWLFCGD